MKSDILQKSVNLQYITLGCLDDGTNESSSKSLMFQVLFCLYTFYRLGALKSLYFYFCNFIKNKKINWKDFCKEFRKKSWKNNNTWNIRLLVDDSFVPSSKQPSVIYCRLTDFWSLHNFVGSLESFSAFLIDILIRFLEAIYYHLFEFLKISSNLSTIISKSSLNNSKK